MLPTHLALIPHRSIKRTTKKQSSISVAFTLGVKVSFLDNAGDHTLRWTTLTEKRPLRRNTLVRPFLARTVTPSYQPGVQESFIVGKFTVSQSKFRKSACKNAFKRLMKSCSSSFLRPLVLWLQRTSSLQS